MSERSRGPRCFRCRYGRCVVGPKSCDPLGLGHSQTSAVLDWSQVPPDGRAVAAADAAGCEADDGLACVAVPEREVCDGPQAATISMIAAANNAVRHPAVAIAVVTRCTYAWQVARMSAILTAALPTVIGLAGCNQSKMVDFGDFCRFLRNTGSHDPHAGDAARRSGGLLRSRRVRRAPSWSPRRRRPSLPGFPCRRTDAVNLLFRHGHAGGWAEPERSDPQPWHWRRRSAACPRAAAAVRAGPRSGTPLAAGCGCLAGPRPSLTFHRATAVRQPGCGTAGL